MSRYIIITNNKTIAFDAEAFDFQTCLRLKKIAEAGRKVKGYIITYLVFDVNGLKSISVYKEDLDVTELMVKYELKEIK